MTIKHFDKFKAISEKLATKNKKDLPSLKQAGLDLVEEYKSKGYIKMLPLDALQLDNYAFIQLIEYLAEKSNTTDEVISPVANQPNSNWMADSSFCFINIRGTGTTVDSHGDFVNAAKLLPILRVSSIHLAPFFECALEIIYGVDSVEIIDENTTNSEYLKNKMSANEQARFFMDVAHLLGKTVGFDIEPHTSQFARIVIDKPQYFRWLKLGDDKNKLANDMKQIDMLKDDYQIKIQKEVLAIRDEVLAKHGLKSLEQRGKDKLTKPAHHEIIDKLIEIGLWTLPAHTWKGAGLPKFSHYDEKGYPEFEYISTEGEDHRKHAFGTLTPFRFYDNIPLNKIPTDDNPPVLNEDTLKFFTGIFPRLYKKFRFDFIRFDYVDHVFDSILDKAGKLPISDRLTPYILKKTIIRAKAGGKKFIGTMAERMGNDIKNYKKVGFDLVLGTDVLGSMDTKLVKDAIKLNKKIEKINARGKKKVNIQFAIDTHDTGHPLFHLTPMTLYGKYGVALRQFVARFSGSGNSIRAKYEVLGNLDGTVGLYKANNNICSLKWQSDADMNSIYHNIEDIFEAMLPHLKTATLGRVFTYKNKVAHWSLDGDDFIIIPVVNTSEKSTVKNILLSAFGGFDSAVIIDPYTNNRENTSVLNINKLEPLQCRLVLVKK